jgi:hypothetical protein
MYAEAVQVLGTLVTIAGLVVVAPYEAGRVVPAVWHSTAPTRNRVRGWLARWLKFLGRDISVNVGDLAGVLGMVTVSATGRVGLSGQGTTQEQLDAIRAAVASIHTELDALRVENTTIRTELNAKLDQLYRDHEKLSQFVREQHERRRQLDARGFPLAALGALLAGVPDSWLATMPADSAAPVSPTWAWWPLAVVGLVAAVVAVRWLVHAWGEVAKGWREGWAEGRPPRPVQPSP